MDGEDEIDKRSHLCDMNEAQTKKLRDMAVKVQYLEQQLQILE